MHLHRHKDQCNASASPAKINKTRLMGHLHISQDK
jgi:hypothetical protein